MRTWPPQKPFLPQDYCIRPRAPDVLAPSQRMRLRAVHAAPRRWAGG
jgi:hypothetical protein